MVISYFFLKYFHNIQNSSPSPPANPQPSFSNVTSIPPVNDVYASSWVNDSTMGNAFDVSTA
jgi:hypothetical protein